MSRVGIYGGTFDPIHVGHMHVITQLIEKNIVDQLLVVPAGSELGRGFGQTPAPALMVEQGLAEGLA